MSPPVFVVAADRLSAGTVLVDGSEGRHAATVVRLRVGDPVVLTDGHGRRGDGAVATVGRNLIEVTVASVVATPGPALRLVVVQALPKGDRGALAVEVMTEMGVDVIVPWAAARCVTRWRDGRAEKALTRWRTSALAASKQSRRTRFPEVAELASTSDVCQLLEAAAVGVVLHEAATESLARLPVPSSGDVVLVVGPEGGVSPEEVAAFRDAGAPAYRLGDTVLRTSTAGTAALAVVLAQTRWR